MKTHNVKKSFGVYSFLIVLTIWCCASGSTTEQAVSGEQKEVGTQISEYVVTTFEDAKGSLWFGTLSKGVARYDGKTLTYLTTKEGLPSNRITSIIEDKAGNMWFGTGEGISKYDGQRFTNYSTGNTLCDNRVSNLLIDSQGDLWVGTWGGICKFDGDQFIDFPVPVPSINTPINEDTKNWITAFLEDSRGNVWFGRDGYGATCYDGKSFTHFTKDDGLYSNNVQAIAEDHAGNIWFGSRVAEKDDPDEHKRFGPGGITRYDGKNFIHFPGIEGLNENDGYEIYVDRTGKVWLGTINQGVYRYDGEVFKNYPVPKPIMSITEDQKGNYWIGCAGGLYKIDLNDQVLNITTNGPWN